ncbi:MAG: hypothetical protein AAF492_20805, partial [Verrucomicrobiota bacterium]
GSGAEPPFPDEDGDGMDDEWELLHGLNPSDPTDALINSDGDPFNNRDEFIADTDPANPTDYFWIRELRIMPGGLEVLFAASCCRIYSLQVLDPMNASNWLEVIGQQDMPGTGGGMILVDPQGATNRMYRVVVEYPAP